MQLWCGWDCNKWHQAIASLAAGCWATPRHIQAVKFVSTQCIIVNHVEASTQQYVTPKRVLHKFKLLDSARYVMEGYAYPRPVEYHICCVAVKNKPNYIWLIHP